MPLPKTQDAATRTREHATQKASHSEMGPAQLLKESMDSSGNPEPDHTGSLEESHKNPKDDDDDVFAAMNAETADFE
ncbi:uncharacterized protein N7529_001576 [Penicillium soppii]|jgi:hypothetical protein|uniref:uncharacterized protein n=1 Tax=Penicillium soppii TaxID=69789 RepID=UPI0025485F0E|nr:uncharacterized protein N7529_001576 [Penicillium soppii]KAJ5875992.1 hypothetical protein N7529_001576 [Penicillium soppii]